jgi:hypothetical protein
LVEGVTGVDPGVTGDVPVPKSKLIAALDGSAGAAAAGAGAAAADAWAGLEAAAGAGWVESAVVAAAGWVESAVAGGAAVPRLMPGEALGSSRASTCSTAGRARGKDFPRPIRGFRECKGLNVMAQQKDR